MTGGEVDAPMSPIEHCAPASATDRGVAVLASAAGDGVAVLASSSNVCVVTSWSDDLVRDGEAWAPRSRWGSTDL
jgi:formylmethanofuran dehydrogenase subunit D